MKFYRILFVVLILFCHQKAFSQVEKYLAAFTFQICKSTTWPNQSNDFIIGVVGKSNVTPYFQQITNEKKIGNQSISLIEWRSVQEIGACHVLFVSKDQTSQLASIVEKFSGTPVLIITESSGTLKGGASVCFSLVDSKIRYELNKTAILRSHLNINGELERMALKVY